LGCIWGDGLLARKLEDESSFGMPSAGGNTLLDKSYSSQTQQYYNN
jgi:hypothetical protein